MRNFDALNREWEDFMLDAYLDEYDAQIMAEEEDDDE